jgi:peroxiredoxin Q/BCP
MLLWLLSGPLPVNSAAPDFTLPDQDGNPVTLSQLRGKNVVLVFCPGDEAAICARQLCELRDRRELAAANPTVVLGISPQSREAQAEFRAKHRLPFPLLSDAGQKVAALYHSRGMFARRTVYVVDKEGVIRFAKRGHPAAEEVLAAA